MRLGRGRNGDGDRRAAWHRDCARDRGKSSYCSRAEAQAGVGASTWQWSENHGGSASWGDRNRHAAGHEGSECGRRSCGEGKRKWTLRAAVGTAFTAAVTLAAAAAAAQAKSLAKGKASAREAAKAKG